MFLGLTAGLAGGVALGAASSPLPWRLARDLARWSQNPASLPPLPQGQLKEVDTVSQLCPSGAGIRVLMAQGRPLLAKGNPEHPLSQGAITPLGLAEVASLYHPARIAGPLRRVDTDRFEPMSWSQARELVLEKLRQAGPNVAGIVGDSPGSLGAVMAGLLKRLGSSSVWTMPSEGLSARRAVALMGGQGQPGYDLDNARLVVALGADAMESFPASLRFRKAVTGGAGVRFVALGPCLGQTAALAHEWIPLAAGKEAYAALGLAWHLFQTGLAPGQAPDMADMAAFKALVLTRFAPRQVERATGIDPARLAALAGELAGSPAAVVIPGSPGGEGVSLAALVAGMAVNVLLGRVNRPGGMYCVPDMPQALPGIPDSGDLLSFLTQVSIGLAEAPQVLLVAGANPVAGLPGPDLMARGVTKASFTVCFNPFLDETARLCDLVLPASLPLERWGGATTPYGLAFAAFSLGRPLVKPVADTRDTGNFLLDCAACMGIPLGFSSTRQMLREQVALLERQGGYVVKGVAPWQVLAGTSQPAQSRDLWRDLLTGRAWAGMCPASGPQRLGAAFLAKAIVPDVLDAGHPLTLAPQASARTGTACLGVPLQSLSTVRESELRQGVSVARMNAATALSVRMKQGDRVRVVSDAGAIPAVLEIDETVMDGHVAMLAGLGRAGFDGIYAGMGANVRTVMAPLPEPGPEPGGGMVWAGCAVGVVKE